MSPSPAQLIQTSRPAPRARVARWLWLVLPFLGAGAGGAERTVVNATGRSMWPTLPAACRLVVERASLEDVKVGPVDGDIISTRLAGIQVVHRAVARLPDGSLVTRGDNNAQPDRLVTTAENFVGVVVGFERPGQIGDLIAPGPALSPTLARN